MSQMTDFDPTHPVVSFVISTYNRRDILLRTLGEIERCGLPRDRFEILVVDNASPDHTAAAIGELFPSAHVFALNANLGSCAKNIAIPCARGQFIVFMDDDSYPLPGSIQKMLEHFATSPTLGAAIFTVTLPDGSQECSAYPDVFIGCGTGFRRTALNEVGFLPEDFFMQAEEYDLSLRLLNAGWDIQSFDDLQVSHLKTPNARRNWRTMRLDVRNNFMVAMRYFPRQWLTRFTLDWMARYYRIAASKQQRTAFWVGLTQGMLNSCKLKHRQPVSLEVFERFTRMSEIEAAMWNAKRQHNLQSVLFIDYGKNIYPYWLAARRCGLNIVAVADSKMPGCHYRGIPLVNDSVARRLNFDAAILSNLSPVHSAARQRHWQAIDPRPVIDLVYCRLNKNRTGLAA